MSPVKTRPTLKDICLAASGISELVRRTPLLTSAWLDTKTGGRVYLKAENLQRTGSFKIRGAANAILAVASEDGVGVITHSSGNHGQAVALAGNHYGLKTTVVMPENANPLKVAATRAYGAKVVQAGVTPENRNQVTAKLAEAQGLRVIHPFDNWRVITGQGTVGVEIAEDCPSVTDTVLIPIGGGGLISGCAIALRDMRPSVRIVGVEPETAAAVRASFEAGERTAVPPSMSIADGARMSVGERPWSVIRELVDETVTVSDEEIIQTVHSLITRTKMVVEPTGAMTVAALVHGKVTTDHAVAVISGGNIDPASFPWPRAGDNERPAGGTSLSQKGNTSDLRR